MAYEKAQAIRLELFHKYRNKRLLGCCGLATGACHGIQRDAGRDGRVQRLDHIRHRNAGDRIARLAYQTAPDGLSVRSVEDLAKTLSAGGERARKKAQKKVMMRQEYNVLKSHLSDFFNAKVQFTCDEKGKGKISIPFKNEEDLERIIGLFDKLK